MVYIECCFQINKNHRNPSIRHTAALCLLCRCGFGMRSTVNSRPFDLHAFHTFLFRLLWRYESPFKMHLEMCFVDNFVCQWWPRDGFIIILLLLLIIDSFLCILQFEYLCGRRKIWELRLISYKMIRKWDRLTEQQTFVFIANRMRSPVHQRFENYKRQIPNSAKSRHHCHPSNEVAYLILTGCMKRKCMP